MKARSKEADFMPSTGTMTIPGVQFHAKPRHIALYTLMILLLSVPLALGAYVFLRYHAWFYGRGIPMYFLVLACVTYISFLKTIARKIIRWIIGEGPYYLLLRALEDR